MTFINFDPKVSEEKIYNEFPNLAQIKLNLTINQFMNLQMDLTLCHFN